MSSVASDSAAQASAPAEIRQATRGAGWWASRLLVTLGAFILVYAAWIPWITVRLDEQGGPSVTVPIGEQFNDILWTQLISLVGASSSEFVMSLLIVLGLLLAPFIWRRSDSLIGAIAAHLLSLWVALATLEVIWVGFFPREATAAYIGTFDREIGVFSGITVTYVTLPGFWLAVVGLVVLWAGLGVLLASEWRTHAFWHGFPTRTTRHTRVSVPGVGLLTLALLIWAYGYLVAAWVTFDCNQLPLLASTCQGYSATGVLTLSLESWFADVLSISNVVLSAFLISAEVARYAVPLLLGVGGLLVILGGWTRPHALPFITWATTWWLGALGIALVTNIGVALITTSTSALLPPGITQAVGAVGILATFLGLFLALLALGILWYGTLTHRDA